nr:MAG TPA: hypothetical protein [Caudoviricetes sp.]
MFKYIYTKKVKKWLKLSFSIYFKYIHNIKTKNLTNQKSKNQITKKHIKKNHISKTKYPYK